MGVVSQLSLCMPTSSRSGGSSGAILCLEGVGSISLVALQVLSSQVASTVLLVRGSLLCMAPVHGLLVSLSP